MEAKLIKMEELNRLKDNKIEYLMKKLDANVWSQFYIKEFNLFLIIYFKSRVKSYSMKVEDEGKKKHFEALIQEQSKSISMQVW